MSAYAFIGVGKRLPAHASPVEVRPQAGMDNDFAKREPAQQLPQSRPFSLVAVADAGLDGNLQRAGVKNPFKEFFKFLRTAQKTGAPAFRGDGAGGAAQVQIDLRIAKSVQGMRQLQKNFRAVCKDLGDQLHPLVVFRQQVGKLFFVEADVCQEGGEIAVGRGKPAMVCPAVYVIGNALHGRHVDFHSLSNAFLLLSAITA